MALPRDLKTPRVVPDHPVIGQHPGLLELKRAVECNAVAIQAEWYYMSNCSYVHMLTPHHVQSLADTFRVLGDPTRVRILDALREGELCVNDLATRIALSESAVSHQLRLLRTMRLVRVRRDGRMAFYAVDDHHILELLAQASTHVQEGA